MMNLIPTIRPYVPQDFTFDRTVNLALPLLSLHKSGKAAKGIYTSGQVLWNLSSRIKAGRDIPLNLGKMVATIGFIAMGVLKPQLQWTLMQAYHILSSAYALVRHGYHKEWSNMAREGVKLAFQMLRLAASHSKSSELRALSLLCQGASNLYSGWNDTQIPEGIVSLLVGIAKLYQAVPELERVHRFYYGTELTQKRWDEIVAKYALSVPQEGTLVPEPAAKIELKKSLELEGIFIEEGISNYAKRVYFNNDLRSARFTNIYFDRCWFSNIALTDAVFNNCTFVISRFKNVSFKNVLFRQSHFYHSFFNNNTLLQSLFDECRFDETYLKRNTLKEVKFLSCDCRGFKVDYSIFKSVAFEKCDLSLAEMVSSYFKSSLISNCNADQAYLKSSYFDNSLITNTELCGTSFLGAKAANTVIEKCKLTDTLFFRAKEEFDIRDCSSHILTRPIIAFPLESRHSGIYGPLIDSGLQRSKVILSPFEFYAHPISEKKLEKEIEEELKWLPEERLSIADSLLSQARPGSQIQYLKDHAEEVLEYVHGLSLPGGDDIEPEFYGEAPEPAEGEDDTGDKDYPRTMMEFALLRYAYAHKIPVMGTCRGSQMINVYFGGTLKNVPLQDGFDRLKNTPFTQFEETEKLRAYIGSQKGVVGESCHHQACDKLGKGLEVVLHHKDIPKLFLTKDGLFLGSQFHPEIHFDHEENLFYGLHKFFKQVIKYSQAKVALMKDIVSLNHAYLPNKRIYEYFFDKCLEKKKRMEISSLIENSATC